MRKRTIVALSIAASLVVLGGIIFVGAMSQVKWDLNSVSFNKRETNEYVISEAYQSISIITSTANVVVLPAEDGATKVICKEQERLKHTVAVREGALVIELTDTRDWKDYLFDFASTKITVYVPAVELNTVSVQNSTGNVKISDLSCTDCSVKNSTGNVLLQNVLVTDELSVTNSTGNVKFKDCDGGEVFVKNSTGDIEGNFLTGKYFAAKSSTGDVEVPESVTGGRCELTTATGNISITIG